MLQEQSETKGLIAADPDYQTLRALADEDVQRRLSVVEYLLSQNRLQSISKITPWNGRAVQGYPIHTLVRGRFVMRDGALVAGGSARSVAVFCALTAPLPPLPANGYMRAHDPA